MEIQKEAFLKIGRQVVLSAHVHFVEHHFDNNEYIPMLRSLVNGIGQLAEKTSGIVAGKEVRTELRKYGHQLFLDLWLQLVAEDGDANEMQVEVQKASEAFNEIFDVE